MFGISKSPTFQFLINPSTLFIIAGMLVAKYRDDPPESTVSVIGSMNSTIPIWFASGLDERRAGGKVMNHSLLESYPILDPMSALEMRLISLIIQGYENSTKWQFKFVDLSRTSGKFYTYNDYLSSPAAGHIQPIANVLITDSQEHIPIWAVVNLNTMKVESWTKGKYEKGNADFITSSATGKLSEEEKIIAGEVALADAKVQKKIRDLGYGNMDEMVPDVWYAGCTSDYPNKKLVQVFFYGIREENGVSIAYPCNFVAYVDLAKNIVREIETLPLHINENPINSISSEELNSSLFFEKLLPPNTIRSELYRLKSNIRPKLSAFQ